MICPHWGCNMTEQELKAQIRKRIHRDLGVQPEWVWEIYWRMSVVRRYLETHTGSDPDIMGDDGDIYVNQMKTVLETLNDVTQNTVPSFSLPHRRQQSTSRKEMIRPQTAQNITDTIELWWSVLPERDKQAITQSWELAYNLLDAFAPTFREWYAGKRTLTPEETRQWFTEFFSAKVFALGDAENPPTHEVYIVSDIFDEEHVQCKVTPFADGTIYVPVCKRRTLPACLLYDMTEFAEHWGMTLSVVLRCLLTGEHTQPRLVCKIYGLPHMVETPVFPPYLSADGVARVWSTLRFSGSTKTWALSRCSLSLCRSYVEALQAWNHVAPEEWKIPDYRVFRTEWKRAQNRVFPVMPAPPSRKHPVEEFAESVQWKLAYPFFPLHPVPMR